MIPSLLTHKCTNSEMMNRLRWKYMYFERFKEIYTCDQAKGEMQLNLSTAKGADLRQVFLSEVGAHRKSSCLQENFA
jgi:hypothetical protein